MASKQVKILRVRSLAKQLICGKILVLFCCIAVGQTSINKPSLDTSVFGKWSRAMSPAITNDGKYGLYNIYNQPVGKSTLVVRAINGSWQMQWIDGQNSVFTSDCKTLFFTLPGDSLCLVKLGDQMVEIISNVKSFKLFGQGSNETLVYISNDGFLTFRNYATGEKKIYDSVINFLIHEDGDNVALYRQFRKNNQVVDWLTLSTGAIRSIWHDTSEVGNFVFNDAGTQLAFEVQQASKEKSIWYCTSNQLKAQLVASTQLSQIAQGLYIESISSHGFTGDSKSLFINLREQEYLMPPPNKVRVDVWNYMDAKLQSEQLYTLAPDNWMGGPQQYLAILHLVTKKVIRLQQENDVTVLVSKKRNDYIAVSNREGGVESIWNSKAKNNLFLVSMATGERIQMKMPSVNNYLEQFSLTGKYIVTKNSKDVLIYDIDLKEIRNVTAKLPIQYWNGLYDQPDKDSGTRSFGIEGWTADDNAMFVSAFNDKDIWKINLADWKATNITEGFGRKNKIIFHLGKSYRSKSISTNEELLLIAFSEKTKDNGFYMVSANKRGTLRPIVWGPYLYSDQYSCDEPIKAKDVNVFLVQRQSASESINWFSTTDFKTFLPFTDCYPERKWNWLTSELHTWKSFAGKTLQGVLYKPENFDSTKKYPVIFHYYEKMSQHLHEYEPAGPCEGWINIPWFVSKGYLVFTPDISYTKGEPGKSVYDAVVSAAKHLSTFSWVNATKMGLQGHSWGGWETNSLVTQTNMFAAAMCSSAPSNFISGYNGISHEGVSLQYFYEAYQCRMGSTLWQDPQGFINNSPVLFANKVSTPLLMMNNKLDRIVSFSQGIEFFTSLRRLNKRVWMLQYDGQEHSLFDEKPLLDFTIRMTQFFDHYLKDSACPKWMLYGIPAKDKGIDYGYELVKEKDPKTGKWLTPKEGGLLTDEEKKKVEALKNRKPVSITID